MFEQRKYHGLYFILGFIIAAMLVILLGCKPAETDGGTYEPEPPQCCTVPEPPQCCTAMTPECEACKEGIPVGEWEENTCGNADVMGWDEEENSWMCGLVIIN